MAVGDFSIPLRCARNDGSGRKVVLHGGGQFWNFSEKPACIVYDGVDQEVVETMQ